MISLPDSFLGRPIAHRALHDRSDRRPENSIPAIQAGISAGYGLEIDVQLSSDGRAMVFHDYDLKRLTGQSGPIQQRSATELGALPLLDCDSSIPTLCEVLTMVAGRVPLLIEIKDQDGAMGPNVGPLEHALAADLQGYSGDVAVMSFNPHSVAVLRDTAPAIARGLVTSAYHADDWPLLPQETRTRLAEIPDLEAVEGSFISHEVAALTMPSVLALKDQGLPILCWTVRSAAQETEARRVADNITFEGYSPTS